MTETTNLQDASHDLLMRIEKADRRFRAAQTLFFFLVAVLLVAISALLLQQSGQARKELVNQNKTIMAQNETLDSLTKNAKQRTDQINDLQNHIDCIVELFQQPDRANLTINNLQGCQITSSGVSDGKDNPSKAATSPEATPPKQSTATGGVSNTTPTATSTPTPITTPSVPAPKESGLDKTPVIGGLFKALGL